VLPRSDRVTQQDVGVKTVAERSSGSLTEVMEHPVTVLSGLGEATGRPTLTTNTQCPVVRRRITSDHAPATSTSRLAKYQLTGHI
jgi:hypothetical protein